MPYIYEMNTAIDKAIGLFGLTGLAKKLGVKPPTIRQWVIGKRPVPIERCVSIEHITNGQVTRKDLRPEDWRDIWHELIEKEVA